LIAAKDVLAVRTFTVDDQPRRTNMDTDDARPICNQGGPGGSRLVWLRDPGDGNDSGPVMCRPGELGELVTAALVEAGLLELAITGEVSRLRATTERATFDLRDPTCAASSRLRVLHDAQLTEALDAELAAGTTVRVWGQLRWDPTQGQLGLVASQIDVVEPL